MIFHGLLNQDPRVLSLQDILNHHRQQSFSTGSKNRSSSSGMDGTRVVYIKRHLNHQLPPTTESLISTHKSLCIDLPISSLHKTLSPSYSSLFRGFHLSRTRIHLTDYIIHVHNSQEICGPKTRFRQVVQSSWSSLIQTIVNHYLRYPPSLM